MGRKIDIGSVAGIDEAIDFLKEFLSQEALQEKIDQVASDLIGEAVDVARETYMGTGVLVTRSAPSETGKHTITATDDEIAFIEFGIGWGVDANNEFAKQSNGAPPVHVGSWSEQNRKPDGRRGPFYESNYMGWHHEGEWITGAETEYLPKPGMENARQYIVDNAEAKIKEVFHFD